MLQAVTLPSGVKGEDDEDEAILPMAPGSWPLDLIPVLFLIPRPVAVSSSSPHRHFFPHDTSRRSNT